MGAEENVAQAMLGQDKANVLMSDGYKFSMAQAGFPLREETFYLSFRKPGRYYIPFDLERIVNALLPDSCAGLSFASQYGYGLTSGMEDAVEGKVRVWCAPKGSWVLQREPILTVTGPSFLVSWLEPMLIWLQFPIQVATECLLNKFSMFDCTCESEAAIVHEVLGAIQYMETVSIQIDPDYPQRVRSRAHALVQAVSRNRVFEVGMRSATCMEMHEIALRECEEVGVGATSNVFLARKLGMRPVGTTGHEHQQRWGDDLTAFRAIRDIRGWKPSYLFDTYDTLGKGIPAAIQAMTEIPVEGAGVCAVRFDSGDQEEQLRRFVQAEKDKGIQPDYIFMDGINTDKALAFEELIRSLEIDPRRCSYGSGGFLVCEASGIPLTRNRVSAVYKLCQTTGVPVMKFSVPSKSSVPGNPVIFRCVGESDQPLPVAGLIGQAGEKPPKGFIALQPQEECPDQALTGDVGESPETRRLIREVKERLQCQ
jgi:nicotinic acid phosphoribosyltransferase